ncbi:uncharacterized protein LOC143102376 isoform X1 [Alosa pseudoharengus]|uniref:uncharacterized protein LOC143102376 isoform X1 n=1 Tax=Alosa pseudoharengus TaxID=34774 RepID=UPI003F891BF2
MKRWDSKENMGVDFYQEESRPIKPPAVPPKKTSLYQTPRGPETPSRPPVSPKPFLRSPASLTSSPTPQHLFPNQSATHDSPNIDHGSADLEHPVSPRPGCPTVVPPKSNIYRHPNVLTSSDTSHGGQTPSPVSFSTTERELEPSPRTALRPPHSPSVPSRSPGPHKTQSQDSEGVVAVESTLTSPSPKPIPTPRTRGIYSAGTQNPTSATPNTSTEEIPLLSEQVSRVHVTSQQPVEYNTLRSENQTVPTPPPIPPKLKTLDRLQPPMTQGNYDRLSRPEPSATSRGNAPARPPPPTFSPPPPPTPSTISPLSSHGRKSEYSRPYLQVLPGDSGYEGTIYEPAPRLGTLPRTLPRSSSEPLLDKREGEQEQHLSKWTKTMEMHPAPFTRYSRPMTVEEKTRWLNQTAQRVCKSLTYFQFMLPGRRDTLRWHISELREIADKVEKSSQKHRMMGIGGGTGSAIGGVTAVVGIALAPVTMGVSLIATAVGAGVAVAGGMGASSAVKKKKYKGADRKRGEDIMKAYRDQVTDLEESLTIVRTGMEELMRHDLTGASEEAAWMAQVAEAASRYGKPGSAKPTVLSTDNILKEFNVFPEVYSTSDGEKQKKTTDKKFASKVRTAAEQLQEGLNDMNCACETFSLATARV